MNTEQLLAQQIRHVLNQSTGDLSPAVAARLHQARTQALSRQRQPVEVLSLAGIGHLAGEFFLNGARTMMLSFTLMAAVAGALYWEEYIQADENEEVDSAMLADELPINAYLDDGFQLWVDHDHASQQSSF